MNASWIGDWFHQSPKNASTGEKKASDYPIGSLQSRAAVRAMIAQRFDARKKMTIVFDEKCQEPYIGKWRESSDGSLVRRCLVPHGMTLQEAEYICSKVGWTSRPEPNDAEDNLIQPQYD